MELLLRLVIWLVKELMKASSSKTSQPQQQPQTVAAPEPSLHGEVRRIVRSLSAVENAAREQLGELESSESDLREQLVPVLQEGVLDRSEELASQGVRLLKAMPQLETQIAFQHAQRFSNEVQQLRVVVEVTKELLRQRANPSDRAVLGDADALAVACYSPILEFARHHQLPIASNAPMTLFYPGGTFIELAFIQQRLAPIGLPDNYRHEPWWWPAIAHEIAHDFYASLPAIEPELIGKLGLEHFEDGALEIGTEAFDRFLHRVWLEEIFADAVGSLMLGPAYLRAMTTIFRNADRPGLVTSIRVSDDGAVGVHPPRHLRVHMTGRYLHRQGFASEARELVRSWDAEHDSPEQAYLVSSQGRQVVPIESLLAMGASIADGIHDAELQALAGHRLADIPGLDFSAPHARRTEEARGLLAAGRPVAFDARTLIAAATHASLDHPDAVQRINDATRLSIVGVGTGERPAQVRALAARPGAKIAGPRSHRTRRIVEAMLLRQILERPSLQRGSGAARS